MSYKLNFPIESDEAKEFWSSHHRLNRVKAIIAFSLDVDNANDNLRRRGYMRGERKRYILAYGKYSNNPTMKNIPFSDSSKSWWIELQEAI